MVPDPLDAPADELAVYDVVGRLVARPMLGTDVMTLGLQDSSEAAGVKLLDAIIGSYKNNLRETEQAINRETVNLLFDREKALRNEMRQLQTEYDAAHNAGPLVGQDTLIAEPRARLETLQQLLADARSRRFCERRSWL